MLKYDYHEGTGGLSDKTKSNYKEIHIYDRILSGNTVKILKIGTPEIITIIVLQFEQLDFTVQYCVQKMPTE